MRPSTTCLITQTELQNHSSSPHNFQTVTCQTRDLANIDEDCLAAVNHGRGTVNKPNFGSLSEFEDKVDVLEDHSWERVLRNQSKKYNSIIGKNVSGVSDNNFIQPGGVHIIIGMYSSNFGQPIMKIVTSSKTSQDWGCVI